MAGKIFLSGGGDERQTFDIDEVFLQGVEKILYIPIASKNEDYESCRQWITRAMEQHKRIAIDMLTDLTQKRVLEKYDAIYVGRGNTFKLLKKIRETRFDEKLINYYQSGGTVYGGSAGAIIWGADIQTAGLGISSDTNDVGLKNTQGLNYLHGYDIQCHFQDDQVIEHQALIQQTKRNIIAIPEESALLIEKDRYKVIGTLPITIISEKEIQKYAPNKIFQLTT